MASVSRRVVLLSQRCPSRASSFDVAPKLTAQWQRSLSTTPSCRADNPPEKASTPKNDSGTIRSSSKDAADALRNLVESLRSLDREVVDHALRKGEQGIPWASQHSKDFNEGDWIVQKEKDSRKVGFWGEGEPSLGQDEDYYGDDLTTLGHDQLEQHRELREYARLIAWELPLLNRKSHSMYSPLRDVERKEHLHAGG